MLCGQLWLPNSSSVLSGFHSSEKRGCSKLSSRKNGSELSILINNRRNPVVLMGQSTLLMDWPVDGSMAHTIIFLFLMWTKSKQPIAVDSGVRTLSFPRKKKTVSRTLRYRVLDWILSLVHIRRIQNFLLGHGKNHLARLDWTRTSCADLIVAASTRTSNHLVRHGHQSKFIRTY